MHRSIDKPDGNKQGYSCTPPLKEKGRNCTRRTQSSHTLFGSTEQLHSWETILNPKTKSLALCLFFLSRCTQHPPFVFCTQLFSSALLCNKPFQLVLYELERAAAELYSVIMSHGCLAAILPESCRDLHSLVVEFHRILWYRNSGRSVSSLLHVASISRSLLTCQVNAQQNCPCPWTVCEPHIEGWQPHDTVLSKYHITFRHTPSAGYKRKSDRSHNTRIF